MKKMLFMAALAGVALTSCVNEEFENVAPMQAMKFNVPVMSQTRANVMGEISEKTYPSDEDFMVFCRSYKGNFAGWESSEDVADYFDSEGEVAKNQANQGTGTASVYWSTELTHYWPEIEYNLVFAAYSPAVLTTAPDAITHTDKGLLIDGFQTEANANKQYDLMYTEHYADRNKNNNGKDAVSLDFKHALSSIVFSAARNDDPGVEYKINDIKIEGTFYQKGNFDQNITASTEDGEYKETSAPIWHLDGETATAALYEPAFEEFTLPKGNPTPFTKGKSALLLIPQEIPADAYVTLYYTKITNPGTDNEKSLATSAKIKMTNFLDSETNQEITEWERGKRYIYRVEFGQNTHIYFKPTVTDWVDHPALIYTIQ